MHICECTCACLYMGVCPHVNKDCVRLEGKSYLQNLEIRMAVVPSKRARMSLHLISSEEFEGWERFLEAVTVKLVLNDGQETASQIRGQEGRALPAESGASRKLTTNRSARPEKRLAGGWSGGRRKVQREVGR